MTALYFHVYSYLYHTFLSSLSFQSHYLAPEPPPSKPNFTSKLVPELSLRNGDNLDLSAKVSGYPPPRITWYKDGTPLKSGPDFQLANKSGAVSLHLPKSEQDDGGVYACLATNPSGQDSTSANVTISGAICLLKIKINLLCLVVDLVGHFKFLDDILARRVILFLSMTFFHKRVNSCCHGRWTI